MILTWNENKDEIFSETSQEIIWKLELRAFFAFIAMLNNNEFWFKIQAKGLKIDSRENIIFALLFYLRNFRNCREED